MRQDFPAFPPDLAHTELLSTHFKLSQYQKVMGNIIAAQLQSSIRNTLDIQGAPVNRLGQGIQ